MTDQADLRLAFVDVSLFEEGAAIRGGVLITDLETRPFEFRCTSRVSPTSLQRMLYGDTLEEYVFVQLVGSPLIKATKEKIDLVLVRLEILLRMRPLLSSPVVYVSRDSKSTLSGGNAGEIKPVVISSHREFPTESSAAKALLTPLLQKRDLLEPFERVHVALNEAHKQRIGDATTGGVRA